MRCGLRAHRPRLVRARPAPLTSYSAPLTSFPRPSRRIPRPSRHIPRPSRHSRAPHTSFPRRRESERALHSECDYAKTTPGPMRRGADPPVNDATTRPPLPSFPRRRESERALHRELDCAKTTPDRCAAAQTLPSMTPPDVPPSRHSRVGGNPTSCVRRRIHGDTPAPQGHRLHSQNGSWMARPDSRLRGNDGVRAGNDGVRAGNDDMDTGMTGVRGRE